MRKSILVVGIILLFVGTALPQVQIGLNSVGGKLGFILPEDPIDNTFGLGVVAELGTITPQIHVDGFFEFWSKSYEESIFGIGVETSFTEFILGGTAKYLIPMDGPINPYAGGGLGFILSRSKAKVGGSEDSESNFDIGLHIAAGAKYALNPQLDGFGEIKYTIDGADYLGIYVGAIFKLK